MVGANSRLSGGFETRSFKAGTIDSPHNRALSKVALYAVYAVWSGNDASHTKANSPSRTGKRGNVFSIAAVTNCPRSAAPALRSVGATLVSKKSAKPLWSAESK